MNLSKNVLKAMVVIAVSAYVGSTAASAEDNSTRAGQPPAPPAGWTDGGFASTTGALEVTSLCC